jgi:hypothetical protein
MEEPIFSDVKLNHVRGGGSSVSMRNMAQSSDAGNSGMAQSSVADDSGRKTTRRKKPVSSLAITTHVASGHTLCRVVFMNNIFLANFKTRIVNESNFFLLSLELAPIPHPSRLARPPNTQKMKEDYGRGKGEVAFTAMLARGDGGGGWSHFQ